MISHYIAAYLNLIKDARPQCDVKQFGCELSWFSVNFDDSHKN